MNLKKTLPAFIGFLVSIPCFAQRKHSVAIGIDYIKNSKPREWKKNDFSTQFTPNSLFHGLNGDAGLWLAYYFRGAYSLKLGLNSYSLHAKAIPVENTPYNALLARQVEVYELLLGYNINQFHLRHYFFQKLNVWLYVGAAHMGDNTFQTRFAYNPYSSWERLRVTKNEDFTNKIRPITQIMIKYNPIRYCFVGIGGTYRYIAKDFQPLSLNISAGLQL